MHYKIGLDINGNKILKVSCTPKICRGFSIQTLGNLPKTHRVLKGNAVDQNVTNKEIKEYLIAQGTAKQKLLLCGVESVGECDFKDGSRSYT